MTRRFVVVFISVLLGLGLIAIVFLQVIGGDNNNNMFTGSSVVVVVGVNGNNVTPLSSLHRKLLGPERSGVKQPERIWGERCTVSDIVINQGPTAPLPSGVPTYTVEIVNACVTGCDISGIHLSCGWFSSVRFINPRIFKRLSYDDCIINSGKPLLNGETLTFQYANTYLYPLAVSSVVCH